MKQLSNHQKFLGTMISSLIALSGCTGLNTLPHIARSGDTVLMALGTIEGIERDNITVTYSPDTGGSIDLTSNLVSLFKLYPDPTSGVALEETWQTYNSGQHEPWLVSMLLTLPPNLTVGTGSVNVSCNPRSACKFPSNYPHVNDVDVGLEILPGTGEANPFTYQAGFGFTGNVDPLQLEPGASAVLLPTANGLQNTDKFGACEITLNLPTSTNAGGVVPDADIYVIAEDLMAITRSQRAVNWSKNGNELTIFITSPLGFTYPEARMSIVLDNPTIVGTSSAHLFTATPSVISVKYFDLAGVEVAAAQRPGATISLKNN